MPDELRDDHIAVIGMACRFPGANTIDQYWHNLTHGVESVTWLTEDELAGAGVPPREYRHPDYVNAAFLIDDVDCFDARFFGYTPREAEVRDPQGRWFLEACFAAVQDSGYDPQHIDGLVGVVGGMANNLYAEHQVKRNAALSAAVGPMAIGVGSAPDYLATTVSYRLGFRGPSINVQTACSTALLAVHTASQLLRSGECDYALAGGVEVELPERKGHLWLEGNIYTRDGHIRPFDAEASGTLFGTGVGVVALKRLSDAMADGDHVYAVLRGSAVNNDGGDRAGFTAPGVEGQVQLIVEALAAAKVHPDTIGFVEAHATGTLVGDPIEVAGLTRAYRAAGCTARQSIPISSVKANIGHLGPASGVAGLIKVCLALKHGHIPPTINFSRPNPNLELAESPFYVVTEPTPWPSGDTPRRAGVSSFGIGGTNVHVIVEEAPPTPARRPAHRHRWQTIVVSAKTATAAAAAARELGRTLESRPDLSLHDVAFTAQVGRPQFSHRYAVPADSLTGAAASLTAAAARPARVAPASGRPVAMMFPGQGTQHVGMGRDLYDAEPVFRDTLDECSRILQPHLGTDLRALLFTDPGDAEAQARLRETRFSQPALFAIEYSLASLLASAGVTPARLIGHSIGEYVAACLAGVFTLSDALAIVATRGRLMQEMAPGAMLAVDAPALLVQPVLPEGVEVAAVNGHRSTVVAGPPEAVAAARAAFDAQQIGCTDLATSHAFHTSLMEPCLKEFAATVTEYDRRPPVLPFVSNVTGTWISAEDAVDPEYWARHLRSTVLFADGVATLCHGADVALLEVGPGDTLSRLARQVIGDAAVPIVVTMRQRLRSVPDDRVLAEALGSMWCHGVRVDWAAWTGECNRVPLPTYPFERQRYWAEADPPSRIDDGGDDEADWPLPAERCSFQPVWREFPLDEPAGSVEGSHILLFDSGHPVLAELAGQLRDGGATVTIARSGHSFSRIGPDEYTLRPADADDMRELFDALAAQPPADIIHGLCVTAPPDSAIDPAAVGLGLSHGFYSLLHLGQQLARRGAGSPVRLHVLSSNMQEISGSERLEPAKALLLGPVMLTQREVPDVTARSIDIALPDALAPAIVATNLRSEITASAAPVQVGWRGRKRWRLDYQMVPMDAPPDRRGEGGTYLITGGLGALGLVVAEDLAERGPCTIVLLSRSPVPPRQEWPALIAVSGPAAARLARLQAIEERGSTVVTLRCDVADERSLADAVALVHETYGRISGVFHSAGVAGGAMMAVRSDAAAAEVLAPKVDGALGLYRLLGAEADFLVLFSSLTAATGTFGQVDYCAANNFLDAFARWGAQQGRPILSIGWMQWTESGMYADREDAAPQAFRELQVGVRYEPATHPLLERRVISSSDTITFSTRLEPGSHWISAEHRLDGADVVVGTALLEMIDAAYRTAVGATPEICDVVFLGPIGVTGPVEIRVELRPDGDGHAVTVNASLDAEGRAWTERARGRVKPMRTTPAPIHDLAAIKARCSRLTLTGDQVVSAGGMIDHGAHWHGNLRSTHVGDREEVSLVEIAEAFRSETGQFRLHPALLDTAVAEANYAEDRLVRGENYLPFGYGRVRTHEPLPPRFWVHIRHLAEPGAEVDRMTIVLMHDDGQEIAHIEEYAERRVDPAAIRATVSGGPPIDVRRPATPRDQRIDEASVSPELGRDVLRRILHWRPAPHLLVVPEGIHRNLRRTQSLTIDVVQRELGDASLTGGQERLVDTVFVPPETEAQRTIAGLWGAALGVAQVGLDDVFFEMGGNSLVAVQLAARMREALAVDLPIAVLFDHPTVRSLAEFVGQQRAGDPIGAQP